MKRDEFPKKTKMIAEDRAAHQCSNPNCGRLCVGPSKSILTKTNNIGIVSHITAAAPKGPRYDETLTNEERKSIENAIFLCANCAQIIDKNQGVDYPKELLIQWKLQHEEKIREQMNLGQTKHITTPKVDLSGYFSKKELAAFALYKDVPVYGEYIERLFDLATKYSDYFKKSELKDLAMDMGNKFLKKEYEALIEHRVRFGKKTRRARRKSKSKVKQE